MPSMSQLVGLIGRSVNDHDVRDLLAVLDLVPSVESDLEEGEIPRHWLQSERYGFDIELTPEGRITTVFLFVSGDDEHKPFEGALVGGLSKLSDQGEIRKALGTPSMARGAVTVSGLGSYGPADRYDFDAVSFHFEFRPDNKLLRLITAMVADVLPENRLQ